MHRTASCRSAFRPAFTPMALCAVASLAASLATSAVAQTPLVSARFVAADNDIAPTPLLPAGERVLGMARFDDDHVLAITGTGRFFTLNASGAREVMIAGQPIPGRPAGTVWAATSMPFAINPLATGGATFTTTVSTAIRPAAHLETAAGDPLQPTVLGYYSGAVVPATRTGFALIRASTHEVLAGPLGGVSTTSFQTNQIFPGRTVTGTIETGPMLSGDGSIALTYRATNALSICLTVAPMGRPRVAIRSDAVIPTDAGPITLAGAMRHISQPLPDGGLFVLATGQDSRQLLLSVPAEGDPAVIAREGNRAPGSDPGFMFSRRAAQPFIPLAASRTGALLFAAELDRNIANEQPRYTIYLWRAGTLTLIARDTEGNTFRPPHSAACLNDDDTVGLIGSTRAVLFRPDVGSVIALARGDVFPAETGLHGAVASIGHSTFVPASNQRWISGGDDTGTPIMTPDGRLYVFGVSQATYYALTLELTGPGCPADQNNDGILDFFDYADFVECFEGGRCPDGRNPDFNRDDFDDFFDYSDFVSAFETGC